MVGPVMGICNCHCEPPIAFTWERQFRMVGPQSPTASLSAYSTDWNDGTGFSPAHPWGAFDYVFAGPTFQSYKMKPMRFEIGDSASYASGTQIIGSFQKNVVVSESSPPLNGHLDSTTVSRVDLPFGIYASNAGAQHSNAIWDYLELFRNGVSLGIIEPGLSTSFLFNSDWWACATLAAFNLTTPLTVVESDVWAWDVYATAQSTFQAVMNVVTDYGAGSGFAAQAAKFWSTATMFGTSDVAGKKFVFASNGPGGITELTMETQSGWTLTIVSSTAIRMTNTAGTISILFVWGVEIPYIEYQDSTKYNSPSSYNSQLRYRPADSGDYDPIYVTGAISETYGFWNPAAATVYSHLRRRTISGPPFWSYTTSADSPASGFPSSITIEPV